MKTKTILFIALILGPFIMGNKAIAQKLPSFAWGNRIGSTGIDIADAVATDASGNVYITGQYSDTVDFDPGPGVAKLMSNGSYDLFIAKYDANGNYVWAKGIGGPSSENGSGIAVDDSGNVYTAGLFTANAGATMDFDPGPGVANLTGNGSSDAFILKLDSNGNYVWAQDIGGPSIDLAYAVAVSTTGNVYVAGTYTGFFSSSYDIFIAKFNRNGINAWTRGAGGLDIDQAQALAIDDSEHIYISGSFGASATFGSTTLTSAGSGDVFISKLDTAGNFLWTNRIGSASNDQANGMSFKAGNIYIVGEFEDTVDFDPGAGVANVISQSIDAFIAKYDLNGNYAWAVNLGGTSIDYGYGISTDNSSNVYTIGSFSKTADFDPGPDSVNITATGGADVFISKLDSSGHYVWSEDMGGPGIYSSWATGYGIAAGASGRYIYSTGSFENTVDIDPTSGVDYLVFAGTNSLHDDVFLQKLTQCVTDSKHEADSACTSFTFQGQTYTQSGTYTQAVSPNGCDTTIYTLDLLITKVQAAITVNGFVLGTTGSHDHYQWYKNGTLIPGATDSTYEVSVNATYSVKVTDLGCSDSTSYAVTNVAVNDVHSISNAVSIYPNPAQNTLHVDTQGDINMQGYIVYNTLGQAIKSGDIKTTTPIYVGDLATGYYMLRIITNKGYVVKPFQIIR